MMGAADLWRNISSRISQKKNGPQLDALLNPTHEKIAAIIDDQQPEERLAQFIALSLRGMDISVEEIAAFYHEQLTNLMATGRLNGELVSGTTDQVLNTHVHSFFMHAGAARDYLGAFIASRIGEDSCKVDSLKLLCKKLRTRHMDADLLLADLVMRGLVSNPNRRVTGKLAAGCWSLPN